MRMAARGRSCQQTAANSLSAGLTFRFKTRSSLAAAIILAVSLTACSLAEFDLTSHRAEDLSDAIADLRPATTPPYAVLNLDPDRLWTGMVRVAPEETSLPDTLVAENVVSLLFAGSPDDDTLPPQSRPQPASLCASGTDSTSSSLRMISARLSA